MLKATNRKFSSKEEAQDYNRKNSEARIMYGGCSSTFACEGCFTVISDDVCCCIIGECPSCGFLPETNGVEFHLTGQPFQLMDNGSILYEEKIYINIDDSIKDIGYIPETLYRKWAIHMSVEVNLQNVSSSSYGCPGILRVTSCPPLG